MKFRKKNSVEKLRLFRQKALQELDENFQILEKQQATET